MSKGYQKMVVMPAEENIDKPVEQIMDTTTPNIVKSRKKINNFIDKLTRIMKIFLKLANIKGYDLIGRVRKSNGEYMPDSDVISLINHAMTHGKLLLGQNEFIRLLHEANIEPDIIINENIKSKLLNLYSNINDDDTATPTQSIKSIEEKQTVIEPQEQRKILKRKHIDTIDHSIDIEKPDEAIEAVNDTASKKRKLNWETLDGGEGLDEENIPDNWEIDPHI